MRISSDTTVAKFLTTFERLTARSGQGSCTKTSGMQFNLESPPKAFWLWAGPLSSGGDYLREPGRLVDILEFQLRLLAGGLEDPDGVGDVLLRMVGHHLHPDPRGAFGNRWEFDEIGDQSEFRHALAHETGQAFRSHLDADDRGRIAVIVEASLTQLVAKTQDVCHQRVALRAPFRRIDDLERFHDSCRLDRRQRIREGRGRAVEAQILLHGAALAGDEAAVGREGLGEAAHDDIDL